MYFVRSFCTSPFGFKIVWIEAERRGGGSSSWPVEGGPLRYGENYTFDQRDSSSLSSYHCLSTPRHFDRLFFHLVHLTHRVLLVDLALLVHPFKIFAKSSWCSWHICSTIIRVQGSKTFAGGWVKVFYYTKRGSCNWGLEQGMRAFAFNESFLLRGFYELAEPTLLSLTPTSQPCTTTMDHAGCFANVLHSVTCAHSPLYPL